MNKQQQVSFSSSLVTPPCFSGCSASSLSGCYAVFGLTLSSVPGLGRENPNQDEVKLLGNCFHTSGAVPRAATPPFPEEAPEGVGRLLSHDREHRGKVFTAAHNESRVP